MRRISISNVIALFVLLFLAVALFGVFFAINQQQQLPANTQTDSPLATFKDLFLFTASGLLSLCSAYIGAFIQSHFQQQEKRRQERREITNAYRAYLEWLLKKGELASIVKTSSSLRDLLPSNGDEYEITAAVLDEAIKNMPLWWEYSTLRDKKTKETVDKAIRSAMENLIAIRNTGSSKDREQVQADFNKAIDALERYEGG